LTRITHGLTTSIAIYWEISTTKDLLNNSRGWMD
jgi:hypothetical protein